MKYLICTGIALAIQTAVLFAETTAFIAEVTVVDANKNTIKTTAPFLPINPLTLPLVLSNYGACTLEISLDTDKPVSGPNDAFDKVNFAINSPVLLKGADGSAYNAEIYSARLPLSLGSTTQILKTGSFTIDVKITRPSDKIE